MRSECGCCCRVGAVVVDSLRCGRAAGVGEKNVGLAYYGGDLRMEGGWSPGSFCQGSWGYVCSLSLLFSSPLSFLVGEAAFTDEFEWDVINILLPRNIALRIERHIYAQEIAERVVVRS
jgi:hypothetical protein